MPDAGDVVLVDFPGVTGIKRRPAVVVSSSTYHAARPDVILGLVTSQVAKTGGATDHVLQDWQAAGLHQPSAFRTFLVTVPRGAIHATVGKLSARDWADVRVCLSRALL